MDSPASAKSSRGDSQARLCLHYVGDAKGNSNIVDQG